MASSDDPGTAVAVRRGRPLNGRPWKARANLSRLCLPRLGVHSERWRSCPPQSQAPACSICTLGPVPRMTGSGCGFLLCRRTLSFCQPSIPRVITECCLEQRKALCDLSEKTQVCKPNGARSLYAGLFLLSLHPVDIKAIGMALARLASGPTLINGGQVRFPPGPRSGWPQLTASFWNYSVQ